MSDKIKHKDGRVVVGEIDIRKMMRMANILFNNGFSEKDVFDFVLLFLIDLAISDMKAFDKFVYFVRDNANYMKSKGVKSVFEFK